MHRSPPSDDIGIRQQIMASCTGAILTSMFMTPLDVVKIRLQAQQKPFQRGSCFIYNNGLIDCLCICTHCTNSSNGTAMAQQRHAWYERPGHFKGTADAFMKIARVEGVTALWSGLPPTLVMAVPATIIYFTAYDRLKYLFGYKETDPSTKYRPVFAGCVARVFAATLISPLELIRTKMQSRQLTYRQLGEVIRISVQEHGLTTMMRGLGPSLMRDVPFSAIYWFGYEWGKANFHRDHRQPGILVTFGIGAASGMLAAVLTLPFDVVKTHRQIELGETEVHGGQYRPQSTWRVMRELYGRNGIAGLYAGLVPRILKVAPACAIMISTYEFGKSYFRAHNTVDQSDNKT